MRNNRSALGAMDHNEGKGISLLTHACAVEGKQLCYTMSQEVESRVLSFQEIHFI